MIPTLTRHHKSNSQVADASDQDMYLQIHIQQIARCTDPDQASANPIPANSMPPTLGQASAQFQQVADASDPDQASTNPIPVACSHSKLHPTQDICISNKLQMLSKPDPASIQIQPGRGI